MTRRWLFVTRHLELAGGLESLSREIAIAALESGDQIVVINHGKDIYADLAELYKYSITYHESPPFDLRSLSMGSVSVARRILKTSNADVLFTCHPGVIDFFPYLMAARLARHSNVIAHHGNLPTLPTPTQHSVWRPPLWHYRFKTSMRLATKGITHAYFHTESQAVAWRKEVSYQTEQNRYWLAPIDINRFQPSNEARVTVRKSLGVPSEAFIVGSVGRLVTQKSFEVLIRAFARVCRESGKDNHLLLVGEGPERNKLEQVARETGSSNVHFLGIREDIPNVLNAMDTFVLPSSDPNETLGIVTLEAMACGVPTIVTDIPGPTATVGNGEFGLIAKSDSVESLASCILRLRDSDLERKRLSVAGCHRAAECSRAKIFSTLVQSLSS